MNTAYASWRRQTKGGTDRSIRPFFLPSAFALVYRWGSGEANAINITASSYPPTRARSKRTALVKQASFHKDAFTLTRFEDQLRLEFDAHVERSRAQTMTSPFMSIQCSPWLGLHAALPSSFHLLLCFPLPLMQVFHSQGYDDTRCVRV